MNKVAIADISHVGLCLDCEYSKHVEAKEDAGYFLCHRFFNGPHLPKVSALGGSRMLGIGETPTR